MLKQACMLLGSGYCHRVISVLWVGDTLVFVTLGTVGVCEALLISFLVRVWRSRDSYPTRPARLHTSTKPAVRAIEVATDAVPSLAFRPTLGSLAQAQKALT